jgi:Family of unknown function (DUF6325)
MTVTRGPVDFVAIGFSGNQFNGEILTELIELVEKEIIRIIDLVIVLKDENGFVAARELQQLDEEIIAMFDPLEIHVSGMITLEDIELVGESLQDNNTAALMLFENLWPIKFREAALRANGTLLVHGRIPPEVYEEALSVVVE